MLFVSRYAAYRIVVSPGSYRWTKNASGLERQVDNDDHFIADFKVGGLTPHQQDLTVQEFRRINPQGAFGAEPITIDGTINQFDAASEGETSNAHEGYQVWQRISRFDTEDGRMCPLRWKDHAEKAIQESSDFGRDVICLDHLELVLPWPSYAEMEPGEVARYALAGRYPIDPILRYEKATENREIVVKGLVAARARQEAEDAERALLQVTA